MTLVYLWIYLISKEKNIFLHKTNKKIIKWNNCVPRYIDFPAK
jgi:hypothetical protein